LHPLLAAAVNLHEPNPACWFIFLWWDDKLERMEIAELKHFDTKKDLKRMFTNHRAVVVVMVGCWITLEVDGREVHKPQMEVC
jgi:hypothetical protein